MENYPKPINKECHKKIMKYLDNSIYKIKMMDGKYGIGFFCYIKCHNKIIPMLITNYKIMNEKYFSNDNHVELLIYNELISVELGPIYYMDKKLDLSIREIKENKIINILDIDNYIFHDESEIFLNQESIYIIHYNNYNNICVSYGIIKHKDNSELLLLCNIKSDSNCYPIFNLTSNKLIGIYQNNSNYYHKGIYFKYLINKLEFIYNENDIINKNNIKNDINIIVILMKKILTKKFIF